jgi:autophagy-related protein 2
LPGSLDENAFNAAPEVGATPDMIQDDLPSNADYLDESYGAAAGFRELRDDDFDEFDVGDIPVSSNSMSGVISSIGGETIRVLTEGGIHPVQHYFNTLPPDSGDCASQYVNISFGEHKFDFSQFWRDLNASTST